MEIGHEVEVGLYYVQFDNDLLEKKIINMNYNKLSIKLTKVQNGEFHIRTNLPIFLYITTSGYTINFNGRRGIGIGNRVIKSNHKINAEFSSNDSIFIRLKKELNELFSIVNYLLNEIKAKEKKVFIIKNSHMDTFFIYDNGRIDISNKRIYKELIAGEIIVNRTDNNELEIKIN